MRRNVEFGIKTTQMFFERAGWQAIILPVQSLNILPTVPGKAIRCMDDRYGQIKSRHNLDLVPRAPAWPGATEGLAVLLKGINFTQKVKNTVGILTGLGFRSGAHGDQKDEIFGCRAIAAMIAGKLPDLAPVSEVEVRQNIKWMDMEHLILEGKSKARSLVINHKPFTTVDPNIEALNQRAYVVDAWLAWMLGIDPERALAFVETLGELLLPPSRRLVYIT